MKINQSIRVNLYFLIKFHPAVKATRKSITKLSGVKSMKRVKINADPIKRQRLFLFLSFYSIPLIPLCFWALVLCEYSKKFLVAAYGIMNKAIKGESTNQMRSPSKICQTLTTWREESSRFRLYSFTGLALWVQTKSWKGEFNFALE